MASYNPETSIREKYGYTLTGIVRAVEDGSQLLAGVRPDDADHSPVSDKWELYIISATETMTAGLLGDVNGDKEVNISDVILFINYVLNDGAEGFIYENADFNLDGEVNITDAIDMITFVLNNV